LRYVGYPHSAIMQEKALTLEEYLDYLKQFPASGPHLEFSHKAREFEIFYAEPDGENLIEIPERAVYQISGDNDKGLIVTLWKSGS